MESKQSVDAVARGLGDGQSGPRAPTSSLSSSFSSMTGAIEALIAKLQEGRSFISTVSLSARGNHSADQNARRDLYAALTEAIALLASSPQCREWQDEIIDRALAYYIIPAVDTSPTRYNEHMAAARELLKQRRSVLLRLPTGAQP